MERMGHKTRNDSARPRIALVLLPYIGYLHCEEEEQSTIFCDFSLYRLQKGHGAQVFYTFIHMPITVKKQLLVFEVQQVRCLPYR